MAADTLTRPVAEAASGAPAPTALVVMISAHGGPAKHRVLWRVPVKDAQAICSDPRTSLRNSALHYFLSTSLPDSARGEAWQWAHDNGRWAGLLDELGVTVLESAATAASAGKGAVTCQ